VPHPCGLQGSDSTDPSCWGFFPVLVWLIQWTRKAPPFRTERERMGHPALESIYNVHARKQFTDC
jgi:hypothetical protein